MKILNSLLIGLLFCPWGLNAQDSLEDSGLDSQLQTCDTQIDYNNFSSGWGIWKDGGTYSDLYNGSIRLRYRYNTSSTTTQPLDLSVYESVEIQFRYYAYGYDSGEFFQLRVFDGEKYVELARWTRGTNLSVNTWITQTVQVPKSLLSSKTRFRFLGRANSTSEYVYLDDIKITGFKDAPVVCSIPTAFETTSLKLSKTTLSFENYDSSVSLPLYYRKVGTDWTTTEISQGRAVLENLEAESTYELMIETICNGICSQNTLGTFTTPPATCHDGIQNGDETGIDCGGSSCQSCGTLTNCQETLIAFEDFEGETNIWAQYNATNNTTYASSGTYSLSFYGSREFECQTSFNLTGADKTKIKFHYVNSSSIEATIFLSILNQETNTWEVIAQQGFGTTGGWFEQEVQRNFYSNTVFRIRASVSTYSYIDDVSITSVECDKVAPQWAGSRTLDSTLYRSGAVGIGIPDPGTYKLAVNGDIKARKVRVEQEGWPDYVFTPDYQLPELPAIEQYIQQNGHLENIPSAEEVAAQGIDLGEMDKRLLEKIEQLTLLMIQMDKEVKALRKENQALGKENKTIKDRLKKLEH